MYLYFLKTLVCGGALIKNYWRECGRNIVILFLISSFILDPITASDLIQQSPQSRVLQSKTSQANLKELIIPQMIRGKSFQGKSKFKVIIFRDLHALEEAQLKIAKAIEYLNQNYVLHKVYVEGAQGDIKTLLYETFPNEKIRSEAAKEYLKKGLLTGAEYADIKLGLTSKIQIYGVEDLMLYLKNFKAFRDVRIQYKDWEIEVDQIENWFKNLKNMTFSQELSEADHLVYAVRNMDNKMEDMMVRLDALFTRISKDKIYSKILLKWDEMSEFRKVVQISNTIDQDRVRSELEILISQFETQLVQEELRRVINLALKFQLEHISMLEYIQALRQIYQKNLLEEQSFENKFPALEEWLNIADKQKSFDHVKIWKNFSEILLELRMNLARKENQGALIRFDNDWSLFKKIIHLDATRLDFWQLKYKENLVNELIDFLTKYKYIQTQSLSKIKKMFHMAMYFYELAIQRDKILIGNTLDHFYKSMSTSSQDQVLVLITGGFHTEAIQNILETKEISYITFTPFVDGQMDNALYEQRMMDDRYDLEKMDFSINHQILRPQIQESQKMLSPPSILGEALGAFGSPLFSERLGLLKRMIDHIEGDYVSLNAVLNNWMDNISYLSPEEFQLLFEALDPKKIFIKLTDLDSNNSRHAQIAIAIVQAAYQTQFPALVRLTRIYFTSNQDNQLSDAIQSDIQNLSDQNKSDVFIFTAKLLAMFFIGIPTFIFSGVLYLADIMLWIDSMSPSFIAAQKRIYNSTRSKLVRDDTLVDDLISADSRTKANIEDVTLSPVVDYHQDDGPSDPAIVEGKLLSDKVVKRKAQKEFLLQAMENHDLSNIDNIMNWLEDISQLSDSQQAQLFEALQDMVFDIPDALPFIPSDTTFSLELEIKLTDQLTKEVLQSLSISDYERDVYERMKVFPPGDAGNLVWGRVVGSINDLIPSGWITESSDGNFREGFVGNFFEIKTNNRTSAYHENIPKDWIDLKEALAQIQKKLPKGFYSVHIHIGQKSLNDSGHLQVNPRYFGRIIKVYEAMWRALLGYGYRAPRQGRVQLHPAAILLGKSGWDNHTAIINLSNKFPTIEVKIITGLLRTDDTGESHIDLDNLQQNLWPAFALLQSLADPSRQIPFALLGLPVLAGEKPTMRRIVKFLDVIYGDDLIGKAIALKHFIGLQNGEAGSTEAELTSRQYEIYLMFKQMGLEVVYDLHTKYGGLDENLIQHIMEAPAVFQRLVKDLMDVKADSRALSEFFPAALALKLQEAMTEANRIDRKTDQRIKKSEIGILLNDSSLEPVQDGQMQDLGTSEKVMRESGITGAKVEKLDRSTAHAEAQNLIRKYGQDRMAQIIIEVSQALENKTSLAGIDDEDIGKITGWVLDEVVLELAQLMRDREDQVEHIQTSAHVIRQKRLLQHEPEMSIMLVYQQIEQSA